MTAIPGFTHGKIDLKWRAITADAEGVTVPAANITYLHQGSSRVGDA